MALKVVLIFATLFNNSKIYIAPLQGNYSETLYTTPFRAIG